MLSVIVIAKNEELQIRRCLESVQWADEIIVLDSGSHDQTMTIAHEFTPHVYSTDWQGYGVQKQRALTHASGDWVLNLDADESVTPSLKKEIQAAIRLDRRDAYRVPIRLCFYAKVLKFSFSPSRHVRLFKRSGANYSSHIVHEKIILPAKARIGRLRSPIMHHSLRDLTHALEKLNRYSSYSAKTRLQNQTSSSVWKACSGSVWMFLRCYFLQGGCWDGRAGFVLACFNAHGSFYRAIKQVYPDQDLASLPDATQLFKFRCKEK